MADKAALVSLETDLYKTNEQPSLKNLQAKWSVSNDSEISCFIVWVELRLMKSASLSTSYASFAKYEQKIEEIFNGIGLQYKVNFKELQP